MSEYCRPALENAWAPREPVKRGELALALLLGLAASTKGTTVVVALPPDPGYLRAHATSASAMA